MNTSKNYPGKNVLISYLKERGNKSSYHGFLNVHHDAIVASKFSNDWKDLDNAWATHFLEEAEKIGLNQKYLKEKVNIERFQHRKNLQTFWQEIIIEYEKENLVPAAQPDFYNKETKKNNELIINFCSDILHELENKSCSHLFYKPIKSDKIIKHPMDLSIINIKLKNDQYRNLREFEDDIRLMFRNCYSYNDVGSKLYCLGEELESVFNKKWTKNIINQIKQKGELKRARDDTDTDGLSTEHWKKQSRILEQNKDNPVYEQTVDKALFISSAYESLVAGDIKPFIKNLKAFLLTRSRMSLASADEAVLQAIVENFLPLKYYIPELSLVMNGKKPKGSGRFGFSDIFILKRAKDNNYTSLELKYISLTGLIKNQKIKFNANELENLDKILEKENEETLLKRPYTYWSKEHQKTNQTTIGEVLNDGLIQLRSYMNTISKGKTVNYSSSGVFDERVKITKSDTNNIKGFVILVVGFRRILWRSVEKVTSSYIYNKG
ncbi:hypothetical protein RclHR1_04260006 [Rhizophagus clarus]|uniref:Bromo domain-containing protein n=1 Tax=Rhizophagus clarus TaxID=94130 RepID=A0A2Z6RFY5_9GLOM|nr:hypothetical protein RclHR1_04260006 [Rhizophagus clarus]GES87637.1 hypothetical protein GLOIN_2v1781474 [Rhizophagus clarus]